METPIEEFKHFGLTVKIWPDEEPENPREWDNLGTMSCWHSQYNLGDEQQPAQPAGEFLEELEEQGAIILPLFLYDHSGITMNTTGFHCRWDSGQVGWIWILKERARKEYGWNRLTAERIKKIETYLQNEVNVYDMYLQGDCYGFEITDADEKHIDSCWGFYGLEDCIEQAKAAVPMNYQRDITIQYGILENAAV